MWSMETVRLIFSNNGKETRQSRKQMQEDAHIHTHTAENEKRRFRFAFSQNGMRDFPEEELRFERENSRM